MILLLRLHGRPHLFPESWLVSSKAVSAVGQAGILPVDLILVQTDLIGLEVTLGLLLIQLTLGGSEDLSDRLIE